MSIRSNSLPVGNDISLQLQDILRKNGIQAQLATDGQNYTLYVQGHDSPLIPYSITRNQYLALVDGGTNSSNKNAYKTFVNIVHNDYDCPKDFVHARNANGKVTMGLHGYRVQDMGRSPMAYYPPHYPTGHMFPHHRMAFPHIIPPMLGWTPRQQDGFHMRRVNGNLVMQHGMMIPEREGGRMKPGELQSGAYGFYYKGNQQQVQQQADPLKDLQAVVKPVEIKVEPAKKYRDLIPSAVYFTNEKWQECLESHGIQIDAENKKLIVQNAGTPYAPAYDLTEQQVKELTANTLKESTVPHRIEIINGLIAQDFNNKLTFDMLNSTEQPNLGIKPETIQRIEPQQMVNDTIVMQEQEQQQFRERDPRIPGFDNPDGVNGQSLEARDKAWYRQVNNGREVNVGEIWVEKDQQNEGKFKMSAVINGEVVSHEISQKQYDKFLALDDYHRMKLFDKVFDEVKMKNIPGQGMNFGQALLSSLALVGETTRMTAGIAHNIEHIKHPHSGPEVYVEGHQHHGRVYVKAGLDTPESIAGRIFDAGMNQGFRDAMLHR